MAPILSRSEFNVPKKQITQDQEVVQSKQGRGSLRAERLRQMIGERIPRKYHRPAQEKTESEETALTRELA